MQNSQRSIRRVAGAYRTVLVAGGIALACFGLSACATNGAPTNGAGRVVSEARPPIQPVGCAAAAFCISIDTSNPDEAIALIARALRTARREEGFFRVQATVEPIRDGSASR